MTDDILTNTGSHLMTAAFYNEMRLLEVDTPYEDTTTTSPSAPLPANDAPTNGEGAQEAPAARHDDHDAGRVGLLEGPLLARVLWEERGVET